MNWTTFFLHLIANSGATITDVKAAIDAVNKQLSGTGSVSDAIIAGVAGAEKVLQDIVA